MTEIHQGEHRSRKANKACMSFRNKTSFTELTMFGQAYEYAEKVVYCIIPRVGSTSWKQIFRFLNQDWAEPVDSPFDIPKLDITQLSLRNTTVYTMDNAIDRTLASRRYTFMFSRDPYSRLWSVYLDKIYLPDTWLTAAKNIVRVRTIKTMKGSEQCPIDISFVEFVGFLTSHNNYNRNWLPIHRICSPCHFRFDFIGKHETFEDDRAFILKKFNIEHVLANEKSDFNALRIAEAVNLIKNNFRLNEKSPGCLPDVKLAERLWTVLKLKGYITANSNFSSAYFTNEETFCQQVTQVIKSDDMTPTDFKRQKDDALSRAYQTLPQDLRNRIRWFYQEDFFIFGYDSSPKNLGF